MKRIITAPTRDIFEVLLRHSHVLATPDPDPYRWVREHLHRPVYSISERNVAAYVDRAFIQLASGDWRKVKQVGPQEFRQVNVAPPKLRFGLGPMPALLLAALTGTFTASAGDGYSQRVSDNWNDVLDGAGTAHDDTGASAYVGQTYSAPNWTINRVALGFDTSALPDNISITLEVLNIYVVTASSQHGQGNILSYVGTYPVANTSYLSTQYGAVILGTYNGTTTGAKAITLSATAYPFVNVVGTTLYSIRANSEFTRVQASDRISIASSESSTPSYRPTLAITYSLIPRSSVAVGPCLIF